MKNQSNNPEEFEPKDSKQKGIKKPTSSEGSVVKKKDKVYKKEEVNFKDAAKKREEEEQPVHSVTKTPKS